MNLWCTISYDNNQSAITLLERFLDRDCLSSYGPSNIEDNKLHMNAFCVIFLTICIAIITVDSIE